MLGGTGNVLQILHYSARYCQLYNLNSQLEVSWSLNCNIAVWNATSSVSAVWNATSVDPAVRSTPLFSHFRCFFTCFIVKSMYEGILNAGLHFCSFFEVRNAPRLDRMELCVSCSAFYFSWTTSSAVQVWGIWNQDRSFQGPGGLQFPGRRSAGTDLLEIVLSIFCADRNWCDSSFSWCPSVWVHP